MALETLDFKSEQTEYGLKLPNGQVQWGTALGRSIDTEPKRSEMVLALTKTATEIGWPPEEFVPRYRWVARTVIEKPGEWALDEPSIAPPFAAVPMDLNQ